MGDTPSDLLKRGNRLLAEGRAAEALKDLDAALEAGPQASALNSRGIALRMLGRLEAALAAFDRALVLDAADALIHANRGAVLADLGQTAAAAESLAAAARLNPRNAVTAHNHGNVLRDLDRFGDALAAYDLALALQPDYVDALIGRALALVDLRRLDDAKIAYDRALALAPDHPKLRLNAALRDLLAGDLGAGFAGYEWRWRNPPNSTWARVFSQPLWLGAEDIAGKTLLLHAEQGMGDTIQFCRYAALAAERGARVVLEVQRSLVRLLSGLEGAAMVLAQGDPLPAFDMHCPLMSLPLAFGGILSRTPYVAADAALSEAWAARLPRGRHVGLAWSGNPALRNDRHRSIPLARFLPVMAECPWISVQKDLRPEDAGPAQGCVLHFGPELGDFADTAALIAQMDVVVAVDTAAAHLAGALGKPVYILLPYVGVDWRWGAAGETSPWYPTARLLRQPAPDDWDAVISRLGVELNA